MAVVKADAYGHGAVPVARAALESFLERLPNRKIPTEPIPDLSPDLAVEVLSKSNTRAEIDR